MTAATTNDPTIDPATLSFEDLVRLEPKLGHLIDNTRKASTEPGYCATTAWPRLKGRLAMLVGWYRPDGPAILRTSEAWDVVIEHVYGLLRCQHRGRRCDH